MMIGKTINGFTLQRLLGTGGMAEVWLAENLGVKVAVKMLLPELCKNEKVIARFKKEAKIMAGLKAAAGAHQARHSGTNCWPTPRKNGQNKTR